MRIRVTPKQKERIRYKAAKAELSMSALLIHSSLYKVPPISQTELDRLQYQLNKNGRQLNSMMQWFNTYQIIMGGEEQDIRGVWNDIRKSLDDAFAWIDQPVSVPTEDPALKSARGEKTENIHIRLSADQRQRIRARAKRSRCSVTQYVLRSILKRNTTLKKMSVEKTYIALMRIGNNLSQAKRYLDTCYGITGDEYQYLRDEFLSEAARFRRAFGWDINIRMEDEKDGVCQDLAGGNTTASI